MAENYLKRTTLHVEGRDIEFAVANLLELHDYGLKQQPRDIEIRDETSRQAVFRMIPTAVKASTGKAVAFVLDAETSAKATWEAVRHQFHEVDRALALPAECPPEGLVKDISTLRSRVGVWIMPDNAQPGMLEDFLLALVHEHDPLIGLAERSTSEAKVAGAGFSDAVRSKAVIHTWLAWQEKPGLPFGTALKARYFDDTAGSAIAFINWIRRLTS